MHPWTPLTCQMSRLRLIIFDVDGTLVDSEADIFGALELAYKAAGIPAPDRRDARRIIGLSLVEAFARLSPDVDHKTILHLVENYKAAYMSLRQEKGSAETSPLFEGARAVLEHLNSDPWTLLAVATGKSRRGLDKLIEGHDLHSFFVSRQVADDHPSKPHPSMILSALAETGVAPENAIMIGDTSYDMEMARAARVSKIGVSWGYHPVQELDADRIANRFIDLPKLVTELLGV